MVMPGKSRSTKYTAIRTTSDLCRHSSMSVRSLLVAALNCRPLTAGSRRMWVLPAIPDRINFQGYADRKPRMRKAPRRGRPQHSPFWDERAWEMPTAFRLQCSFSGLAPGSWGFIKSTCWFRRTRCLACRTSISRPMGWSRSQRSTSIKGSGKGLIGSALVSSAFRKVHAFCGIVRAL